ncbi:MAG: terminase family protein [Thermomicrobiales bacterium]|nr:terminase family protein [Thermomicrobiales bacterium]
MTSLMPPPPVGKASTAATFRETLAAALDPVVFAKKVGITPDAWQEAILRSSARQHILLCSRQSGKSTCAAILATHKAVYYPGSLTLLVAPSKQQSGEQLARVRSILAAADAEAQPLKDNASTLQLRNGSRILVLAADSGTIRGYTPDCVSLDEAGWIGDETYRAVRPMLAVSQGQLVVLSTPNGRRGFFFDIWEAGIGWERSQVTVYDCPRIAPEWIEAERQAMPEWVFAAEYLCEFTDTTTSAFRSLDIENALTEDTEQWTL